jgi:hypothetical protein
MAERRTAAENPPIRPETERRPRVGVGRSVPIRETNPSGTCFRAPQDRRSGTTLARNPSTKGDGIDRDATSMHRDECVSCYLGKVAEADERGEGTVTGPGAPR